ncbi:MAG TPA: family 16 glycoside hydrolase, partial [Flavisolibacter sp.]|nr:family 16 glycoside hydrolase [Flavisolibacter sp.]
IEVVSFDGNSVHLVNGKVTMRLFNSRHLVNGVEQPLKAGRIQLQSEGAEIFYRQIEVLPLTKMPSVLKDFKHK